MITKECGGRNNCIQKSDCRLTQKIESEKMFQVEDGRTVGNPGERAQKPHLNPATLMQERRNKLYGEDSTKLIREHISVQFYSSHAIAVYLWFLSDQFPLTGTATGPQDRPCCIFSHVTPILSIGWDQTFDQTSSATAANELMRHSFRD